MKDIAEEIVYFVVVVLSVVYLTCCNKSSFKVCLDFNGVSTAITCFSTVTCTIMCIALLIGVKVSDSVIKKINKICYILVIAIRVE